MTSNDVRDHVQQARETLGDVGCPFCCITLRCSDHGVQKVEGSGAGSGYQ